MILTQEYKEHWSATSKLVFRFVFCYFSLYILLSFTGTVFEAPIRWIGDTIVGIDYEYSVHGYGSGDHTYAYRSLVFILVSSVIATVIWSVLDRRRASYNLLFYWFLVFVRMYIIYFMFVYGFIKVFKTQFPYPSLSRMLKPLKDFSPMGLAWTYMGYSKGFNIFTGGLEVLGGLLLIPRRTQTLGALVVAGVMTHVAAMNFMFDIPVKLFSVHLVLMALLIFSTDIKRFVNVFITNKPTNAYNYFRPTLKPYYNKLTLGLKVVLTLYFMYSFSASGMKDVKKWGDEREKPNLYGIWETNYFIKNNDTIPATFEDNKRWQHLIIDYKDNAMVTKLNRKKIGFTHLPVIA